MKINEIFQTKTNKIIEINGWIRYNRNSKTIGFLELFDGSNLAGVQVVYKQDVNESDFKLLSSLPLFTPLILSGKIVKNNNGNYEVELLKIIKIYPSPDSEFILGKKEHGLEYLRTQAHLRGKTKLFQAVFSLRSTISLAIHQFFQNQGYYYLNSPIITSNDAEGAGEAFLVKIADKKSFKNFWTNESSLSVSGQLHAEAFAQSLGAVYTFAPTFRAENSNTKKHASEFWMIEPEAAFTSYFEMMELGEALIKSIFKTVLTTNLVELQFLEQKTNKPLISTLQRLINTKYQRLSYRDALVKLQLAIENGVKFEVDKIEFGLDFGTEHEKYLASEADAPVFVYDFPTSIKAFYMYQNDDNETVRSFDLLFPDIGEIIGGSQREERYDFLIDALKRRKVDPTDLQWYLDLRKAGYAPSSGFGLGLERLIMFITGMDNIRDVIPFPRTPGELKF